MSEVGPRGNHEVPNVRHNRSTVDSTLDDRSREFSALTVGEAVNVACAELGIRKEDLAYEIRDSGLLNILGLGSDLATILVHPESIPYAARVSSSRVVSQKRPITTHPSIDELDPNAIEEAAYRFHLPESSVRQKFRRGDLIYDPNQRKLVAALDPQSSTKKSRSAASFAEASERLPRGYWAETDRMILLLQRGTRKLLWRIVERLEPIVRAVVGKVKETSETFGLEEEDLLQIGRIEITGLVESYDPHSETKIYVYLRQWLYYRILRAVDDNLPIRVPANFASGSDLEQRAAFFRSPTTYQQIEEVPEDAFVGEEMGFEETLSEDLYRRVVASVRLSERQLYVLEHRYGLNEISEMTLEQVGAGLGVTRERVRQLQLAAIEAVKVHLYFSFGFNAGLDLSTGKWRTPKISPAVLRGDFSLGESPDQERSISAVQEWTGPVLPHKKQHADRTAAKLVHTQRTQPADPVRKPSSSAGYAGGRVQDLARMLIDEKGVVAVSEIVNRYAISRASEASIVGKFRRMGLIEITPGYWARPLRESVYREAALSLASNGLMAVDSLLMHLRFNPNLRSDELPPAAVFRAFLQAHPNFRVDKVGTVHLERPPASILGKSI